MLLPRRALPESMAEPYVDTNIIIRLLTGDDPEKQQRARRLFERIEQKELQVTALLTVIADTVYVLSSPKFYNLPRSEIAALLRPLRLWGFRIRNRSVVLQALDLQHSISTCPMRSSTPPCSTRGPRSSTRSIKTLNSCQR